MVATEAPPPKHVVHHAPGGLCCQPAEDHRPGQARYGYPKREDHQRALAKELHESFRVGIMHQMLPKQASDLVLQTFGNVVR